MDAVGGGAQRVVLGVAARVPRGVDDDHAPRRRHLRRARADGGLAVHVAERVAREGAVVLQVAEGAADDVGSQRLRPLRRRRPVVLLDRRLADGVLGLGEDEVRGEGGTDELAFLEPSQHRQRHGAVAAVSLVGSVAHFVVAVDEVVGGDEVQRREDLVVEVVEAGVEDGHHDAFAVESHLVDGGDADLGELAERGSVVQNRRGGVSPLSVRLSRQDPQVQFLSVPNDRQSGADANLFPD